MKPFAFAVLLVVLMPDLASAQNNWATGHIYTPADPTGSETYRTTQDPGWWQRTFVGWDQNGDGQYTGGERGILPMAFDGVLGLGWAIAKPVLDHLLDLLPEEDFESLVQKFGAVVYYFKIANCWLPIDYASVLLISFYTFQGGFWAIKMTLKIMPFIG